jgi:hypothetical protein
MNANIFTKLIMVSNYQSVGKKLMKRMDGIFHQNQGSARISSPETDANSAASSTDTLAT